MSHLLFAHEFTQITSLLEHESLSTLVYLLLLGQLVGAILSVLYLELALLVKWVDVLVVHPVEIAGAPLDGRGFHAPVI